MSRVLLATGTNLTGQWFVITQSQGQLDPAISRRSKSISIHNMGFHPPILLCDGDNFGGQQVVCTSFGAINDLSQSPWGNWADRIASIQMPAGFELQQMKTGSPSVEMESLLEHVDAVLRSYSCQQHDGCGDFQSSLWNPDICICGHNAATHGLPLGSGVVRGSFAARWEQTVGQMQHEERQVMKQLLERTQNP